MTGIFSGDRICTETINSFHESHQSAAAWQYLSLANGCGWIGTKLPPVEVVLIPGAVLR